MDIAPQDLVVIDGSLGEGGGQVLRSALSLSLVTGRPTRVENIRRRRDRPGLLRQHLTAVRAAADLGNARVAGAELGSMSVEFHPQGIRAGTFRLSIGTAGSTTLVAQALLPALLRADAPSELWIEGGTHNPLAPTFDFFDRTFLPMLRRMGAVVDASIERYGFFPAGGGSVRVAIRPARLQPIELLERGPVRSMSAWARVADLPLSIAERELAVVRDKLDIPADRTRKDLVEQGPGNVISIDVESGAGTTVFTALGQPRLSAERVAATVVRDVRAFTRDAVPIGEHLADQLLLPFALAGGGVFRTTRPSTHTTTNARVIEAFLPVAFELDDEGGGAWRVTVRGIGSA